MKHLKASLFCFLLLIGHILSAQEQPSTKKIEKMIRAVLDSAYQASVHICAYDTLKGREKDGLFSGVVVSPEGHILTVAHAAKPTEVYQITFPNGTKLIAKGLGRMAIKQGRNKDLDMAMLRIIKGDGFPFVSMGWNSRAIIGQPAISISYPGSFVRKQPNIRFGRIVSTDVKSGYFVSSCKMEPGDSGGPLFDGMGRLIGLHSWIKNSEELNYEVPVELYRKYWNALNKPIDYRELPADSDSLEVPFGRSEVQILGSVESLISANEKFSKSTMKLFSSRNGKQLFIQGTLISLNGSKESFILSKSSMVGDSVYIELDNKRFSLTVMKRDKENDLILLRSPKSLPNGLRLKQGHAISIAYADLGRFLTSPISGKPNKVGVISTEYDKMPMRFSVGYFGANARFIDQKITITDITPGGAADGALKLNDQITAINGIKISRPPEYGAELMKYLAGDSLSVDALREGQAIQVNVYLPAYPGANHVASKYQGGRSARSDGFNKIFLQDAAILPQECGGPVFDSEGTFYGINIARHSRTSTVVMPNDVLSQFVYDTLLLSEKK